MEPHEDKPWKAMVHREAERDEEANDRWLWALLTSPSAVSARPEGLSGTSRAGCNLSQTVWGNIWESVALRTVNVSNPETISCGGRFRTPTYCWDCSARRHNAVLQLRQYDAACLVPLDYYHLVYKRSPPVCRTLSPLITWGKSLEKIIQFSPRVANGGVSGTHQSLRSFRADRKGR
jgi:hypothetical protein